MTQTLRRRYRRLLWAYPAGYRTERGEEIIETLVEAAPPGRTRPTVRQAVDLAVNGLLARFGFGYVPGLAAGAALAASAGLAVAGGLGAFLWLARPCCAQSPATLAPAVWPAVAILAAVFPRAGRPLIGLGLVGAAALLAAEPGPVLVTQYVVPAAFAVIAAVGWRRDAPAGQRLVAGAGVPVVLVATMVLGTVIPTREVYPVSHLDGDLPTSLGRIGFLDATLLHPLAPAWFGLLLLAGAAWRVARHGRFDRSWLWCALLLAVPSVPLARMALAWVGNPGYRLPWYPESMTVALAVAAGVVAGIWAAGRHPRPAASATPASPGPGRALGVAATAVLAGAAGLAAAAWVHSEWLADPGTLSTHQYVYFGPFRTAGPVVYAAWLLTAVGYALFGVRVARGLTALALLATVGLPAAVDAAVFAVPGDAVLAAFVTLGLLAFAALGDRPTRAERWAVPVVAAGLCAVAIGLAGAAGAYDITVPARMAGLAAVPYAVAAVAAAVALRMREGRAAASLVVLGVSAAALSAVVPATSTEYGVAVAVGAVAGAAGLLGSSIEAVRGRFRPVT